MKVTSSTNEQELCLLFPTQKYVTASAISSIVH